MQSAGDDIAKKGHATVREIINHRLGDSNRWNLALVQRDEVWDDVRMRQLADSLLAGYPIGSILLSQLNADSVDQAREIAAGPDQSRTARDADAGSLQILDGQQRINALVSVFTEHGHYGRFFLDVAARRPQPSPAQRQTNKARTMPHLRHAPLDAPVFENRDRWIDLTRWHSWAESQSELRSESIDPTTVQGLLSSLDPEFTAELTDTEAETAAKNFRSIVDAWGSQRIPVVTAELESALDILEVFTRINLGGVQVAGDDVYFAGVKTYWRDAEQQMQSVLSSAEFLKNRMAALRLTSRLASRGLGYGDIMPLTVERLVGARGEVLRRALEELTEPDSRFLSRSAAFSAWYREASSLGFVLRMVTPEHWDEVYAWVTASQRGDLEWFEENRELIDTYLLGTTLFRYRSIMRDTFRRLALVEALEAGQSGQHFPLETIVEVARGVTEFKGPRGRQVLALESDADRAALAGGGGWILTALEQRIPYDWEARETVDGEEDGKFDWDHIFPKAQAHRMWRGTRNTHHPDRSLVNSTGNFWALKAFANRSLQDMVGKEKFKALEAWTSEDSAQKIWPRERWSLTPDEIENFIRIDELLDNEPAHIEEAMRIFRETTASRSLRLLDHALARFPKLRAFASDGGDRIDATQPSADYRVALELKASDTSLTTATVENARAELDTRARRLGDLIAARIEGNHGIRSTWIEPSRGSKPLTFWIAFELGSGPCVELMPKWKSGKPAWFEMKAYPRKGLHAKARLHPDFDHIKLPVGWSSSDEEVVEQFLLLVDRVERSYKSTSI